MPKNNMKGKIKKIIPKKIHSRKVLDRNSFFSHRRMVQRCSFAKKVPLVIGKVAQAASGFCMDKCYF